MVHIDPDLKSKVENLTARVQDNPSEAIVEPSVNTRLVNNLQAESVFEQHGKTFRFECDEGVWNGGHGTAPTPLRYFLSGVGFCQQVWFAKCASLLDIQIDTLEITVRTRFDIRGELGIPNIDPGLEEIIVETEIIADAGLDEVRRLVEMVETRCPLFSTLKRSNSIRENVILNGKKI